MKKKEDALAEVTVKVPVLLPDRILAYLFDTVGIRIPQSALAKYWTHCKEFMPWAQDEALDGSHVPITIYGDTARYGTGFDQSKVTGCFMSLVLWRPKSTRMSQFLLWNLEGERSLGWKSHNPLYLAVVKSLNAAFDGFSLGGARLSHRFCVTQIKGDWEYHWQTWRLKRYYKTRFICWRCSAENHTNATHSMTDVSDHPSWQATEVSHNEFVVNGMQDNHVCVLAANKHINRIQTTI